MANKKNLYSTLTNFYNVNDENFIEFMSELYSELLANHRDIEYVKKHLNEEIVSKLESYLEDGRFNVNIQQKVEEYINNNTTIDNKISAVDRKKANLSGDNITGNFTFSNNTGIKGKLTDGTIGNIAVLNTDNEIIIGTTSGKIKDVILASYNKERPLFMNEDLQRKELMLFILQYMRL